MHGVNKTQHSRGGKGGRNVSDGRFMLKRDATCYTLRSPTTIKEARTPSLKMGCSTSANSHVSSRLMRELTGATNKQGWFERLP